MTLEAELRKIKKIFIDTATIIYYIEAHLKYGILSKNIVEAFQNGNIIAYSSVITLAEVLPKPVQNGKEELADRFTEFLKNGKNFNLIDITPQIAEKAGRLRGLYPSLKGLDSIQISTAIESQVDAFITNDINLKQVSEIRVLVLKDFL